MIDDVQAFLEAWLVASKHEAKSRPDATIVIALNRLGEGIATRVGHGQKVEVALRPFAKAVAAGRAPNGESDPATLSAWAMRDGDRLLVNVSMGFASSVQAYDNRGRLEMPGDLAWSYRQHGPFFRSGRLVFQSATSIQDAGVRYAYRVGGLLRVPKGYASAGAVRGVWILDDSHLSEENGRLTLKTLDEPRAFSVANSERVLRREETWDARGPVVRRIGVKSRDLDLRVVDAWILAHRGEPIGRGVVPKNRPMAIAIKRRRQRVELDLDGRTLLFDLANHGGIPRVVRVSGE